ncbi:MAG TPA: alpha/beta hydrolase [Wenzhouxiangellaceae bacterium]|nr:alpha/beta hydrolase [Wenzhouxiangellaceae bacterium]
MRQRGQTQPCPEHLPNASVVLVPERGHDAVADPCVVDIVAAFLDNPGGRLDVSCVFDLEPRFHD